MHSLLALCASAAACGLPPVQPLEIPGTTAVAASTQARDAKQTIAFRAKTVHLGDGRVIEDGVVIVEGGIVRRVGQGLALPADALVVEHAGALTPGLIALHSADGAGAELFDSTRSVMSEADVGYAFAPEHSDFERCLAAGVTSLVLAPPAASLVPGATSVVKTSGGRVLKPRAQLVIGLSASALSRNVFPTSYGGALAELERQFEKPSGPFVRAKSGDLPVLLDVTTREEILRAIDFAARHKLRGALNGSLWTEELAQAVKDSGLAVVCDPADAGRDERGARSVVALAKAGVPFGFGLGSPARSPHSLRFAAALAVRQGLAAERALAALTGEAAKIAGVADRVGLLEPGREADLVLWSGDPLDLRSSVQAVYVDGSRVHGSLR